MTLKELLQELRGLLDDEASPPLWSSLRLTAYINEALNEACVRANLIYDESSPVTDLECEAGSNTVELSPQITGIDRVYATVAGTKRLLDRTTVDKLDDRYGARWKTTTGQPRDFYDEQTYLGIYPTPTADTPLSLAVWRLPLEPLNADTDEPEIAPHLHQALLDWAVFLAFSRRNSDAGDSPRANAAAERFTATFGVRPDENVRRKRRLKKVPVCRPIW